MLNSSRLQAIILSKDRPAQVKLLIESICRNVKPQYLHNISVVYLATSVEATLAYSILEKRYTGIKWINQAASSYREAVLSLLNLNSVGYDFSMFLTDDDIIYRPWPDNPMDTFNHMECRCFSLRLGLNTIIQDPYTGMQTVAPQSGFVGYGEHFIMWHWRNAPSYMNFGYPLSVDGHIFFTRQLHDILEDLQFNNPNQQEVIWQNKIDTLSSRMAAFRHSVLVNTPLNRVQSTCMNRAGETFGQNPEEMTRRFLKGEKLDLDSIDFSNIVGCHQELEIKWK